MGQFVEWQRPTLTPEMFRGFLRNIFMSDSGHDTATLASLDDADCLDLVPPFTLQELGTMLRDIHYGTAADADGMVAEMFRIPLQKCLLNIYHSMLASGSFETSWQHTLFTMLPKPGDSSQPNNWRPMAVLKIIYTIFSRLPDNMLQVVMDDRQPNDQTGFHPNTGVDDAFVVLECPFAIPTPLMGGDLAYMYGTFSGVLSLKKCTVHFFFWHP